MNLEGGFSHKSTQITRLMLLNQVIYEALGFYFDGTKNTPIYIFITNG